MKVVKFEGNAYFEWKKLKEEGKVTHLPTGIYGVKETDFQKEVRRLFNVYDLTQGENEIEDVIYFLEENVENKSGFYAPCDGDVDYILIFNDKIWVYIYGQDEYMGHGDYSLYILVNGVSVPEGTSLEEVKEVAAWLGEAFSC